MRNVELMLSSLREKKKVPARSIWEANTFLFAVS